ncbi:MAG: hypothetical protein GY821_11145 [Gammaproteobacteria bacterium]|nr:hypothetical protein [Gammaproteobacteria bacterium]
MSAAFPSALEELPNLACDAHLEKKLTELDAAWHRTDQNITEGKNQHITIEVDDDGNSSWTLSYDRKDEKESTTFFKGLKQMDVADMMKMSILILSMRTILQSVMTS